MPEYAVAVEDAAVSECGVWADVSKGSNVAAPTNGSAIADLSGRRNDVYEIQIGVLLDKATSVGVIADRGKIVPAGVVLGCEVCFFDCRVVFNLAAAIRRDDFELFVADRFCNVDDVFCVAGSAKDKELFAHGSL